MTDFVPMQIFPSGPVDMSVPTPTPDSVPQPRPTLQALIPVSRTVFLDEISGDVPPVLGDVYEFDYFLLHPIDGALQRAWFSSSHEIAQTNFKLKLVDEKGKDLSAWQSYKTLPMLATVFAPQVGAMGGESVFLRVSTESQDARLFVTLELLVSEVI